MPTSVASLSESRSRSGSAETTSPSVQSVSHGSTGRKRGRPTKAERAARGVLSGRVQKVPRARGRPSNAAREAEELTRRSRLSQVTNLEDVDDEDDEDDEYEVDYQKLRPVEHEIARLDVQQNWHNLPRNAVNRIHELLEDIQRTVLVRLESADAQTAAGDVLQTVTRNIERQVRKERFPRGPQTAEDSFNFEKILNTSRSLETQLTPMMHSVDLLKAELAKERNLLEQDRAAKAKLEEEIAADRVKSARATRNHHAILQNAASSSRNHKDAVALSPAAPRTQLAEVTQDRTIRPIVQQLQRHARSMSRNIAQVEGIDVAIAKSKALVQDVLYRKLDDEQYERVMLG